MDTLFCNELLQEIFHRVPPSSAASVALVSRRWHRLLRSSTTSLSLNFPPPYNPTTITSFSTFLSQHPFLSSLSVAADHPILLAIASSCPNLRHLQFLSPPVSVFSLYTLSKYCDNLSSISITVSRPLCFSWLHNFKSLNSLSLFITNPLAGTDAEPGEVKDDVVDIELSLESLSLSGISSGDHGISYIWRNLSYVKKLQLYSCESVGDHSSFSRFMRLASGLQEVELRSCRSIIDIFLMTLAENCASLNSLVMYDGGSRESLLQFFNHSSSRLRSLDLRLPLDLDNTHLIALSSNLHLKGLISLRLQSCCVVSGEGLNAVGRAFCDELQELSLINCKIIEREVGLLTSLGQGLKMLRRLDLSYNDMLLDKELVSMLASCNSLVELKLRGCSSLTAAALAALPKSCSKLQHLDITYCSQIEVQGVEFFMLNAPTSLRRLHVEQTKLSQLAKTWAFNKFVQVLT